jgi:predicted glutamine amidotransferase
MIRLMLTGLEPRGNDAAGIAMQKTDGQIFVLKNDLTPWQFTKSQAYKDFIEEFLKDDIKQVILHTRAATKGLARFNKNNHPMFSGRSAVVHNGVINNDDELFRNFDIPRTAETDSDILRAITDKWGITKDTIEKLNKLRGGVATAAIHPEYPGWMLLARSGNPLTIASTEDFFAFASTKDVLHRAMRPLVFRFKQWFQVQSVNLAFSPFPDNTAYLIGPEGLEWHEEFKSFTGTYVEPNRRVYINYQERQRKWDAEAKTPQATVKATTEVETDGKLIVKCPKCDKRLALTPEQFASDRSDLRCPEKSGGCGALLSESASAEKVTVN